MKYKFETKTIGDCCDIIKESIHPEKGQFYTCFSLPAFDNSNTPEILNGEEIKSSKFVLDENTILFNKLNPKFRRVWNIHSLEKYENTICSTEFLPLKAKANIEQDYLYYYVSSPYFTRLMDGIRTGTSNSQQRIDWKQFLREPINVPSLPIQRKAVSLLRNIDKKIELNNAINNNLEQQAQAIFKSWFIDFEPFSNRKPSEWSVSTLGNVSIMGAGGDKPQNVSPIKTDLYEYPIYSNGLSNKGLYGFTDKPKISEESVTVSARGTIGFACLRHIPYVPIVRLVTLIPKTEIVSAKYLYLWLKQLHITGTGTTQQQLTVPDFQKTEILVPSQKIVTLFTATVEPIFEKIWANQNENEKLSSLRDTLLPKLMSGELDVSDTDL